MKLAVRPCTAPKNLYGHFKLLSAIADQVYKASVIVETQGNNMITILVVAYRETVAELGGGL
jgi:hypothetical protein